MGSFHSVIGSGTSHYTPIRNHNDNVNHCGACGTIYSHASPEYHANVNDESQNHYPAVLCGIWLNTRDRALYGEDSRTAEDFIMYETMGSHTFHSTRLPQRVVRTPKPSKIVAALLRHTDFTKSERSALNRGFFSTLDIFGAPIGDATQLEGCHIHGCLFVEHGNLVFQAADRSRVPLLLTEYHTLNSVRVKGATIGPNSLVFRCSDDDYDAQLPPPPSSNPDKPESYAPVALCRKTSHKLFSLFRDTYDLTVKPKNFCRHCRRWTPGGLATRRSNTGLDSRHHPPTSSSESRGHCASNKTRLPPPPLRLSWPLFTLRRFGFYGNSLFKLEAGRRAPRGEGHYLFVIEGLRGFRRYFEKYVHRRRSASPHVSPRVQSKHGMSVCLERSDVCSLLPLTQPRQAEPPDTVLQVPDPHTRPSITQPPGHRQRPVVNATSTVHPKKKSNSLSCPLKPPHCPANTAEFALSDTAKSESGVGHQSSCPQLASPESAVLDDISTLPDPPPPPPAVVPCDDGTSICLAQSPYDNIQALVHSRSSRHRYSDAKPVITLAWLNSLSTHNTGRPYASRRAMTALVRSSQPPIVSGPNQLLNDPCGQTRLERGHSRLSETRCFFPDDCRLTSTALVRRSKTSAHESTCLSERLAGQSPNRTVDVAQAMLGPVVQPQQSGCLMLDSDEVQSTQSPPYYNLHSPEAFFQMARTKSLTQCASVMMCGSECAANRQKRRTSPVFPSSPASWNFTHPTGSGHVVNANPLDRSHAGDGLRSCSSAATASSHDPGPQPAGSHVCDSCQSVHASSPRGAAAPLHYAALDFDSSTVPELDNLPASSTMLFHRTRGHPFLGETASSRATYPNHAYGTLMSRAALGVHQPGYSTSNSEPSINLPQNGPDTDLPTNYVAICQLQTLAMRAVLNATT